MMERYSNITRYNLCLCLLHLPLLLHLRAYDTLSTSEARSRERSLLLCSQRTAFQKQKEKNNREVA
jgi:hypothetical protein